MAKSWLVATALTVIAAPALAASPEGDWLVAEGTAVIRVAPCGDAYCGKIAWTPGPGTDEHNPDPAKRDQSMVGTTIIIDMKPAGNNRWEGSMYNPENGKTYSGHIAMMSADVLRVEGCLLVFCGGENWTRTAPEPVAALPGAPASPGVPASPDTHAGGDTPALHPAVGAPARAK